MKQLLAAVLLHLVACAPDGVPTIGVFARQLNFPMYYATSDGEEGGGRINRVSEASAGEAVGSTELASGLSFPGALAVDHFGNVFVTETRPAPLGALKTVRHGETTVRDVVVELDYPTGVVVDSFQQSYIAENGRNRIARIGLRDGLVAFGDELPSPEFLAIDEDDSIVATEGDSGVIRVFRADGTLATLSAPIAGLASVAIDAAGNVHALVLEPNSGTGRVLLVDPQGSTTEILADLINPTALAFDGANALYVAEGSPANRISRLDPGAVSRRVIILTTGEPQAIAFTPF